MKTIFARTLIVWLIVGQVIYLCLPHFTSRPPTELERESVQNPSPAVQAALEHELERTTEYESRRTIGIIMLLLALDGVIIGCFWNFGVTRGRERTRTGN